jgi:O-acetyl-ADP-ribose deacetylase (regulator of RNase III)
MIELAQGDLLGVPVEAIVNTLNGMCVMGKGIG